MGTWLYIGNTGVNILEILDLFARGYSCAEIRHQCPGLSKEDLAQAAAAILKNIIRHVSVEIVMSGSDTLSIARPARLHDDAPWTVDEDEELRRFIRYRFDPCAIARLLRRSRQAVSTRIEQINKAATR